MAIEARSLAPLPGDVDFTVGASLGSGPEVAGLFEHGRLRAGSVLVHGAAGAVGHAPSHEAGAVIGTGRAADRRMFSTLTRRSSSTSTTTPWKTSAESIWC